MSEEWNTIDTAPIGVQVRLGWWDDYTYYSGKGDDLRWKTKIALAWEMRGFVFKSPVLTDDGKVATHWQSLPEPPATEKETA